MISPDSENIYLKSSQFMTYYKFWILLSSDRICYTTYFRFILFMLQFPPYQPLLSDYQ
jgi:hypothetical protein